MELAKYTSCEWELLKRFQGQRLKVKVRVRSRKFFVRSGGITMKLATNTRPITGKCRKKFSRLTVKGQGHSEAKYSTLFWLRDTIN